MAAASLDPVWCGTAALAMALVLADPAEAQVAPERGVFITQIADDSRVTVMQRKSDSLAQIT